MLNKEERKLLVTNLKKILKDAIALELDKINPNMTKKVSKNIKSAASDIAKEFVKKSHEETKKLRKEEEKKLKKAVITNIAVEDAY